MEKLQGNGGTAPVTDSKWYFRLCCQTRCSMEKAYGSAVQGASLLLILLPFSGPSVPPERTGPPEGMSLLHPQISKKQKPTPRPALPSGLQPE